jgi:regulator of protease activity HflC (stomatin/prohibitin superfamily)
MHPFEIIPGVKVIRPKQRGLVERFGNYRKFAEPGFHFIIPLVDAIYRVNVSEQSVNINPSDMITKDNLNAEVDLVIYFQVRKNEEDVKKSEYNADNYRQQIVSLAQTTARNVVGTMKFEAVNSKRSELNERLRRELDKETEKWGIDVVRVEMEEITPPSDVQDSMNEIIKAENKKDAAEDFATAEETKADGERRAEIKRAQGKKRARELEAEGEAKAIETVADAKAQEIEVVNTAVQEYFQGPAVEYKKLETVVDSLDQNSKYILDTDKDLTTVLSEVGGVTPIKSDDDEVDDKDIVDMDVDLKEQAKQQAEAEQEAEEA